jgi:hypothetical protein
LPRSMSRVRPPSPAPDFDWKAPRLPRAFSMFRAVSPDGQFLEMALIYALVARYPSGKGEVCKTFIRRFDSDPRLQLYLSSLTLSLEPNPPNKVPPIQRRYGGVGQRSGTRPGYRQMHRYRQVQSPEHARGWPHARLTSIGHRGGISVRQRRRGSPQYPRKRSELASVS